MTSDLARRASALAEVGRNADALDLARQALQEDPEDVAALIVLTQCLIRLERHSEAYQSGSRLLAAAPQTGLPHRLLSVVYQRIGTPDQAYAAAVGSTRVDPFDALNHVQVAMTADAVPGRRPEAIAAAQHAVSLDAQLADAHFAVGYTARDRTTKETAYRRALALDPDHSGAANNLTVLRGKRPFTPMSELVSGYLAVLGKDPTYETSRSNLVGLCYRFSRRTYWIGLVVAVAAIVASTTPGLPGAWSVARLLVGAGVLVGLGTYAQRMRRLLGPGARAYLSRAFRSDTALMLVSGQSVAVVLLGVVMLVSASSQPWTTLLLPVLWANLALVPLARAAHRRRARRT